MAQRSAPTKSNLLRLKARIKLAKEGYELLEKKREILIQEILGSSAKLKHSMREIYASAPQAYESYKKGIIANGRTNVDLFLSYMNAEPEIDVEERSVMGVIVPKLNLHGVISEIAVLDTMYSGTIDLTRKKYAALLEKLVSWAEIYITIQRLSAELKKTQRLVRSLENIIIPQLSREIRIIEIVLEENEREEFFRRKVLKRKSGG